MTNVSNMKTRRSEAKGKNNISVNKRKRVNLQRRTLRVSLRKGRFTSAKVTLREAAIDNKIVRVHLARHNFNDLKNTKVQARRKTRSFIVAKPKPSPLNKRAALTTQNIYNSVTRRVSKTPSPVKLFRQTNPPKRKMVVNNGKVTKLNPDDYFVKRLKAKQNGKVYYLKSTPYKTVAEGMLNYKFHQLVNDVKNMQLPTPSWKIKVIIRHNKIAAIIFTNKAELERSLSFNSEDDKYQIVIDNKPALLLGSPGKVNSSAEIEVLLSIMETIDKTSNMILFK